MAIERRKYPRFTVRSNAFAFFKSEPSKPIPIVNISLGGLAIGVNEINTDASGPSDASKLEILTDDCHFFMDKLPYQLLSPRRSFQQNAGEPVQHIYGVQFADLMSSQRNQLNYFIRNHTRGGITPKFMHKFNQQLHHLIGKKNFGDACRSLWLHRPST